MKLKLLLVFLMFLSLSAEAQYSFSGQMENDLWQNNVYLSLIEDYRKLSGVFSEQIISKQTCDSLGYFIFSGNQLDTENRIYRIHVDNCKDEVQSLNHFEGHCEDSKEILFIAKNNDGETRVEFISKEDAAEEFIAETGENFVDFLGENPLRDLYIVFIDDEHQTEAKMVTISQTLQEINGVGILLFTAS